MVGVLVGMAHRKSDMKFSMRWFMLFTLLAALLTFSVVQAVKPGPPPRVQGPPDSVLRAVQQQVPGMIVDTIRPETVNGEPAWEVTGSDPKGNRWMLDVRPDGNVLMYEKNP